MDITQKTAQLNEEMGRVPKASRAVTNHDTGLLGIIAVICMVIDHAGAIFYPSADWMRIVGRIALPLFAWGIAVGAEHTRSIERYALRLFVLMIVSQPFYMLALNHPAPLTSITAFMQSLKLNIFATLLLGLIGIWGLKERREWMTAVALMVSYFISMDYGIRGVLCILLLWGVRNNPLGLAVCFASYCVIWGAGSKTVWRTGAFTVTLQMCALLALPLMLWPTSRRTRTPKWLMYAMYPGHLAALWIIKEFL